LSSRTPAKRRAGPALDQERAAQARRRRIRWAIAGAAAAAAIAAAVAVPLATRSDAPTSGAQPTAQPTTTTARLPGLRTSPAPWPASAPGLAERLNVLALPPVGDESYHIHAMLRIYVDGQPVPVPADIGLDPATGVVSPLHTHDGSGIVHMEAARPYPFTLGEFFDVWGVRLTASALGGYTNAGGKTVQVYANGKPVADPVGYVMHSHDRIVVGFGTPGSFPTDPATTFPSGL